MTAYSGAVASGVVYDAPGPRTRRLTVIGGAFAAVVAAALFYVLVLQLLADKGQLSPELWGPLVDPANENFHLVWQRIGHGATNTLIAAACAIAAALAFGTVLAVVRVQLKELGMRRFAGVPALAVVPLRALSWLLGAVTRAFVEVFRGLPVVITIFFAGRGLPEFGISFDNDMWYVVIGLTIYNGVVIAEILRSGMEGLPGGQSEASAALGLMPLQTTRIILLPQAYPDHAAGADQPARGGPQGHVAGVHRELRGDARGRQADHRRSREPDPGVLRHRRGLHRRQLRLVLAGAVRAAPPRSRQYRKVAYAICRLQSIGVR